MLQYLTDHCSSKIVNEFCKVKKITQSENGRIDIKLENIIQRFQKNQSLSQLRPKRCTDITLICQNELSGMIPKCFECHKKVLSTRSKVFKNLIEKMPDFQKSLKIKGNHRDIESLVKFLYEDRIKINQVTPELLKLANEYKIQPLIEFCVQTICARLDSVDSPTTPQIKYKLTVV